MFAFVRFSKSLLMFCFVLFSVSSGFAKEKYYIAGAGPSTQIVRLFATEFSKTKEGEKYHFEVPDRSTKHKGGVNITNKFIFGRTGRPLNEKERRMNKEEIILAKIPISFVTGSGVTLNRLSLDQLIGIYKGKINNWNEIGGGDGKIVLIGREPTEIVLTVLAKDFSFLRSAKYSLIAKRDHQVLTYLRSSNGKFGLSFGSKQNFSGLNSIQVEGFNRGIAFVLV